MELVSCDAKCMYDQGFLQIGLACLNGLLVFRALRALQSGAVEHLGTVLEQHLNRGSGDGSTTVTRDQTEQCTMRASTNGGMRPNDKDIT